MARLLVASQENPDTRNPGRGIFVFTHLEARRIQTMTGFVTSGDFDNVEVVENVEYKNAEERAKILAV